MIVSWWIRYVNFSKTDTAIISSISIVFVLIKDLTYTIIANFRLYTKALVFPGFILLLFLFYSAFDVLNPFSL